jgi:hypothetical protein
MEAGDDFTCVRALIQDRLVHESCVPDCAEVMPVVENPGDFVQDVVEAKW